MSDIGDLLEVGTIAKAHGTSGEVVVRLITNQTERLNHGSRLMSDLGELVVLKSQNQPNASVPNIDNEHQITSLKFMIMMSSKTSYTVSPHFRASPFTEIGFDSTEIRFDVIRFLTLPRPGMFLSQPSIRFGSIPNTNRFDSI